MFKKILIANRGEIAVRVMRACREMGISTAAVYSEADRRSLHVRYADEAIAIGPAPSAESYLRIDRVIEAARSCGADAIHPGYGFLSENPTFARAVAEAGVTFIGPSPQAMELLGSKTAARALAVGAGLPVVPGVQSNLESFEQIAEAADRVGYPVMIKASAGGGGKGMRVVASAAELDAAWRNARSEARNAFGDDSVYLEKLIDRPRHVEIQILGDQHGKLLHLGERECSLQRRHQKVMEESPSPVVDEALRLRMGETAVNIGRLAGYWSAGTVEFLLDADGNFYFLEVNARLQVEHPVTELVTGLDLVKEQIRVAAGYRLAFDQHEVRQRGAAIECRISAEDPAQDFFPSPGEITALVMPAGPGVRNDSGVYQGWRVPLEYDPLMAKLIVWGSDRQEAISRTRRALGEYEVGGVKTTIPFFLRVLRDPEYLAGRLDTGLVGRILAQGDEAARISEREDLVEVPGGAPEERSRDSGLVAMLAASLEANTAHSSNSPACGRVAKESRWKAAGRDALLRASTPGGR